LYPAPRNVEFAHVIVIAFGDRRAHL